ncbi:MAG TPA: mismatch-specific DNA-glycosylase [Puia sp.]|nr:mismatch-specific DNA-glycosylase [Puia sp.]
MILPDVLAPDLDIVFCGTAAGDRSAIRQAYYAGPGNQFYPALYTCGLTTRQLLPHEFRDVLTHRIGLTDLAKKVHGADDTLRSEDFDIEGFRKKIQLFQPRLVCFNGKKAASVYFGIRDTKKIAYGLQLGIIGRSKLYVAPSTSGAARGAWDVGLWHELKKHIV